MSELLKKIDPDGVIIAEVNRRYGYASLHAPEYTTERDRILVDVLGKRGLLHDPDEPTVASLVAKIEALPTIWIDTATAHHPDARMEAATHLHAIGRSAVLAVLKPEKAEPRWSFGAWVVLSFDRSGLPAGIVVGFTSRGGLLVQFKASSEPSAFEPTAQFRNATVDEIMAARRALS